jgi:hypothetical protein
MAEQTFTSGQILTAAQMTTLQTNTGLAFISSTNVGASPVASVTVSNCFSSTYDNYRIIIAGVTAGAVDFSIQLTGITGSVYTYQGFYQLLGVAAINTFASVNQTSMGLGAFSATGNDFVQFEISSPNLAKIKYGQLTSNSTLLSSVQGGQINSTVQSTGFTVSPASGNITNGTISVYGYRK